MLRPYYHTQNTVSSNTASLSPYQALKKKPQPSGNNKNNKLLSTSG